MIFMKHLATKCLSPFILGNILQQFQKGYLSNLFLFIEKVKES